MSRWRKGEERDEERGDEAGEDRIEEMGEGLRARIRLEIGQELLTFTGVDGTAGGLFHPPLSLEEALARIGGPMDLPAFPGLRPELDERDLAAAGWGVVFAPRVDPAVREALSPLLELRREQAAAIHGLHFRELTYAPGESAWDFLARHGALPGTVDPRRLPFYLLLVGGPEAIPFELQERLGRFHAVGRIDFDHPEDYARYAESVVAAESSPPDRRPEVTLFGPRHPDDPATAVLAEMLLEPLAGALRSQEGLGGWAVRTCFGPAASKEGLHRLLGGGEAPAVLFFAGHPLLFPPDDPRQRREQGALVCSEWPGPRGRRGGPLPPEHYFAAADLLAGADLHGLVAFLFASYGVGTPRREPLFPDLDEEEELTAKPFVAELPRALLAHPRGGALAVIGKTGPAWGYPFPRVRGRRQTGAFESVFRSLQEGEPVGAALLVLEQAHAEASAYLRSLLAGRDSPAAPGRSTPGPPALDQGTLDPGDLVALWTACHSLRFTLLGDPAVRAATAAREVRLFQPYPLGELMISEVAEGPPAGEEGAGRGGVASPYAARVTGLVLQGLTELEEGYQAQGRSLEEVTPAVELARRMLATVPSPSRWDELLGPFYTTTQMSKLLGEISRQAVMDRVQRRTLLGLKTADGVWVYPRFQLDERNEVLSGLAAVLQAFDPDEVDEWTLAAWLVSPLQPLGGRSVIDWLREEREPEAVLALARDAARRLGG